MRIKSIPIHIIRLLQQSLKANKYYNWYVFSHHLSQKLEATVMKSYTHKPYDATSHESTEGKTVVFVCNGNNESGGWADRLKGILSTYEVCKEESIAFRLLFTSPFQLTDYLLPNTYDWTIPEDMVVFECPHTEVVAFEIGQESKYQAMKQKQLLRLRLRDSKAEQIHVYCNAMSSYYGDFSGMFNALFRPSPRLEQSIGKQMALLGKDYVSISARFIEALGDFTDTQKTEPLPPHLRKLLIERCIQAVKRIHERHPESRILVNSDSKTFLEAVGRLDYTYVIPGEIIHLDVTSGSTLDTYSLYEKTMLDFFMIANAKAIYRIDGQWIHPSGYPLAASKVYNRPFVRLEVRGERLEVRG